MNQLLDEIKQAYPGFEDTDLTHEEPRSIHWRLEQFARFLVDAYGTGQRDALVPAFEIAERHLTTGDAEGRDAIVLGFLEAIQNIASHRQFGPTVFVEYLGPNSRRAWDDLNVAWNGKSSLADVVRDETGAQPRKSWWHFWRRPRVSPRKALETVENPELRALIEGMTRDHSRKTKR